MMVVLIIVFIVMVILFSDMMLVLSFWKCIMIKVKYRLSGSEIIVISVECMCYRNRV